VSEAVVQARLGVGVKIAGFYDAVSGTVSYVVKDLASDACAIIDSVLDIDVQSGRVSSALADRIIEYVRADGGRVECILETHAHADHVSAASYLKSSLGGRIGIGERIKEVQLDFARIFDLPAGFLTDGSQFDDLFTDGEEFAIGSATVRVIATPGHTPADVAYQIGAAVFVGDTIFMPDVGTARCDFPGGSARELYHSVRRLLSLPDDTVLYLCHDYPPSSRAIRWSTTVQEQRRSNIHIRDEISEEAFVHMRQRRDAVLQQPRLFVPSMRINLAIDAAPRVDALDPVTLSIG